MKKNSKNSKNFESFLKSFENRILTGMYRPGQRLVEAELTEQLQASRYWIRNSLKIFAEKGLVKIIPYKGAIVADLNSKEIEDIYAIRVSLERTAIHLAAQKMTPANFDKLNQLADIFETTYRSNKTQQMIQANTDFHDYIFECADNEPLLLLIKDMRARFHIVRYAAWSSPQVLKKIVEEHRIILNALKNSDLEILDSVTAKHISYSKDIYLAQVKTIEALMNGEGET